MVKLLLFPFLLAAGCLTAGLYGAAHDQISYSVSPDYFHAYKFDQFGIPDHLRGRAGAALVGWSASWWMGLLIGVPVLLVGLMLPGWKAYLTRSLAAFGVVAATALVVGLGGLAYAYFAVPAGAAPADVPVKVGDPTAFARVGVMHSFSYLGGFLGVLTASLYLAVERYRLGRTPHSRLRAKE